MVEAIRIVPQRTAEASKRTASRGSLREAFSIQSKRASRTMDRRTNRVYLPERSIWWGSHSPNI